MNETTSTLNIPESIRNFDLKTAAIVIPLLAMIFWLYSDQHNDARYMRQVDHERDMRNIQETLARLEKGQNIILEHMLNNQNIKTNP